MQPTSTATPRRAGEVCSCSSVCQSAWMRRRSGPTSDQLHEARDHRLGADRREVDGELEVAARAGEAAHLTLAELGMAYALAHAEHAVDLVVAAAVAVVLDGDAVVAVDAALRRRISE